jgi:Tol biopolymer transport system component
MTPSFQKTSCWFIKSVCTLVIMFFSIGSVTAQVTSTTASVANGKIAFMSLRDGGFWDPEIYVMDPDGSNRMNLSNNPTGPRRRWLQGDYYPAWSPDGAKIAFSSLRFPDFENRHIYVMDADGSNQIRLTNNWDRNPAWSPDGSKIAFASARGTGGLRIYVMDVDGSNQIPITNSAPAADDEPVWSPDGSRIAFTRVTNSWPGPASEVYVMNADGSNQTRLTNAPGRWSDWPAWSPDGSKLAFDSNMNFSGYQIYVMNADGSNRIALTNLGNNASPDWSPGGEKIAFSSDRSGHQAIYLMDKDGLNQIRLTNNLTCNEGAPRWQRLPAPAVATSTP